MKILSFKDFKRDYKEYYHDKSEYFSIRTEDDMQEILFDIYNIDDFEINYDNKTIELY